MLFNLQALRGIAALLVLVFHSLPHFRVMGLSNSVFEFIAQHGNLGVDIFFVISGYVMALTTTTANNSVSTSLHFISRRFARIYLGYWPIFLLALLAYFYHRPDYLMDKELLQSFLLINDNPADLVIAPAWSLTYELYFYSVVGLTLSSGFIKPVPTFSVILTLVVLKTVFTEPGENGLVDFFFSVYIFEFVSGYLLFNYWRFLSAKTWISVALLTGGACLPFVLFLGADFGYVRFAVTCCFSTCLVWLMILLEKHGRHITFGIIKKIGDSSYTLYLSHTLLLGFFYSFGIRNFFVSHDMALIGFVLCMVFIVLASYLFYEWVEKPLYMKANQRIRKIATVGI